MMLVVIFAFILVTSGEWVKEMENDGFYEGDIELDPDQKLNLEHGKSIFATNGRGHWPHGKPIPYVIDRSIGFLGRRAIKSAIEQYHEHTCIRFQPQNGERAYIKFYKGKGCHSPIGYRGVNSISLGSGCQSTGIIIHEIGHSLGIFHEQSRPDRDRYVKILWNNILNGKSGNFRKQGSNINSYGTSYDYNSIMHYGAKTFGKGFLFKSTTIETLNKKYQNVIGQRKGFSPIDIKQINAMYGCS